MRAAAWIKENPWYAVAALAWGGAAGLAVLWAGLFVIGWGRTPAVATAAQTRTPAKGQGAEADMTLAAFALQLPAGPKKVFVNHFKMSDLYGGRYIRCRETHYAFQIEGGGKLAWAYAPQDSDIGRALYEGLKNGEERSAVLELEAVGPGGEPARRGDDAFAIVGIPGAYSGTNK